MIELKHFYNFKCDSTNCRQHSEIEIQSNSLVNAIVKAREQGWQISRDRKKCFCPYCNGYYSWRSRY